MPPTVLMASLRIWLLCTQFHNQPNTIPIGAPLFQQPNPSSGRTTHAPHPQGAWVITSPWVHTPHFVHTQVPCTTLALTRHTESQYPGSIQHPHISAIYRRSTHSASRTLCSPPCIPRALTFTHYKQPNLLQGVSSQVYTGTQPIMNP
jgi:hypothetical protein